MNLYAIMGIPDQATRNFAYAQSLEIDALKAEIEELKKKPSHIVGFRPKVCGQTLETSFKKVM